MMISNYININTDEGRAKVKTWKCDKVLHLFTTVCTIFYARSFCPGVDEIVLVVTIVLLVQSVVHIGAWWQNTFTGHKKNNQPVTSMDYYVRSRKWKQLAEKQRSQL